MEHTIMLMPAWAFRIYFISCLSETILGPCALGKEGEEDGTLTRRARGGVKDRKGSRDADLILHPS
eukprot:7030047-Pyramimonas_sp.AAC.1